MRWREGEVCRTLKFRIPPPNFETTIQNLLQRSNSLLLLFRPLKITPPHTQNHGWGGGRERNSGTNLTLSSNPTHLKLPYKLPLQSAYKTSIAC